MTIGYRYSVPRCPRYLASILVSMAAFVFAGFAVADDVLWAAPASDVQHFTSDDGRGQVMSLTTDAGIEYDRNFATLDQRAGQSSFSISQALSVDADFMVSHAQALEQDNTVLGFTSRNLTVSYMKGAGEDYSELGGSYAGINPYQFHGGYAQDYSYDGYALDYRAGKFGHVQYGQATVKSEGLSDRKTQYVQWAGDRAYFKFSEFSRGAEKIGEGFDVGIGIGDNKLIGLQAMELDDDRSLQRIRLQFDGKQSRQYWLDVTAHQNSLYRANDDVSVMFNFRTLLGAKPVTNYLAADDATAEENPGATTTPKKKGISKRLIVIGVGAAAAASLSSSGSEPQDRQVRFRSQTEAAFDVLNRINPVSVRENREYGGWVFLNADGSYASTSPVPGDNDSVRLPNRRLVIPSGARSTATFHTHAAFDPRYDNENFSPTDLESDRAVNNDGYLATPGGQFKFHNVVTGEILTLGRIAN